MWKFDYLSHVIIFIFYISSSAVLGKWPQMVQIGPKWYNLAPNIPKWPKIIQNCPKELKMALNDPQLPSTTMFGHLGSLRAIYDYLGGFKAVLENFGLIWAIFGHLLHWNSYL